MFFLRPMGPFLKHGLSVLCFRGCENAVAPVTRGQTGLGVIPSVDCRVFYVCTRIFMCLLARLWKDIVFGWQPSPLVSYKCFWDLITGILLEDWTRDVVVWFWWSKMCEHKCTCLVRGLCYIRDVFFTRDVCFHTTPFFITVIYYILSSGPPIVDLLRSNWVGSLGSRPSRPVFFTWSLGK